jgi:oxygen-independent coproporphyrinogen-3 oxidase
VLDRIHTPNRPAAAAREALDLGFEHVSLDLIYGTPGESDDDLLRSVDTAIETGVDHVSAYALVIEEGTAMARRVRRGELAAPDNDVLAHRYELVDERLSAAGLTWYEVSNWARPGGACRHNLGYWDGGQWWGAGPGAHGFIGTTRWWNVKHPNTYGTMLADATLPVAGFEQLGADALHTEEVMLQIRLRQGLPLVRLDAAERERAETAVADGLLLADGDSLILTDRGRLLADGVVRSLLG